MKGILAPIDTEVFQEKLEVVEGAVPPELSGVLVRTGPNDQHKPWGGYHLCAAFSNLLPSPLPPCTSNFEAVC